MAENNILLKQLEDYFGAKIVDYRIEKDQVVVDVAPQVLRETCLVLRDEPTFSFEMMMDLCGIDYQEYGLDEWRKQSATLSGFSRGVMEQGHRAPTEMKPKARFAVAYQLLSIKHNHRLRLKVFVPGEHPMLDSVYDIWQSSNWYEREAFDLYGILFKGHPDLRRILTDYGFIGYPFRKDFPISGTVEIRYDAGQERCIYEPVGIVPRTLVPKVIRDDHRYLITEEEGISHG
jgi:NADH-quinone oxidoreductase subunit C